MTSNHPDNILINKRRVFNLNKLNETQEHILVRSRDVVMWCDLFLANLSKENRDEKQVFLNNLRFTSQPIFGS